MIGFGRRHDSLLQIHVNIQASLRRC